MTTIRGPSVTPISLLSLFGRREDFEWDQSPSPTEFRPTDRMEEVLRKTEEGWEVGRRE